MIGFQTKNSTYYVDQANKLIWGGKLGNQPRQYLNGVMIIGAPGQFIFVDGGSMTTGVIKNYI